MKDNVPTFAPNTVEFRWREHGFQSKRPGCFSSPRARTWGYRNEPFAWMRALRLKPHPVGRFDPIEAFAADLAKFENLTFRIAWR